MWILNKMMIGCDKASFLISKKEEGSLSVKDALQLKMHLMACKMCRHFEDQSEFMNEQVTELLSADSKESEDKTMSDEKKSALKKLMEEN